MENIKDEILKAYNFRFACKEFDSSKKISDDDFKFILETARLSPSSCGFEPWKFLVINDMKLREELKPLCWGAQTQLSTASHFLIILSRNINDLKYDSKYISDFMKNVQKLSDNIIEIKTKFYKDFQEEQFKLLESDRAVFDWGCKQTYIALANMMTAAAQIGIDSCPIEGFDRDKVEKLLEDKGILDKNHFGVSCMVAFGYRKNGPKHEKTRQSLDKIVEFI
ncbi:NAD(P)H-dependent oxidoreductase [Clostridium sp.]|uniref:NAD(P)H-dependent oxidoreductase n=1 Tax=Clostridium sp. TaxID=1506 RepID=UPI002A92069C|nr:NAD(P)H-dependent oxidoreductase [Clostridium sp.]MDY6011382.1 NAD(P)H-dependent oxidoreductase [Clostridium sp.]